MLDVVLMGSIVGVYGLLGWRPDPVWMLLGVGVLMTTIADTAFAIQQAGARCGRRRKVQLRLDSGSTGDRLRRMGWAPGKREEAARPTGLRAVALPLIAQVLAAGIQIYALFEPVGKSERIGTVAVLVVSSVQIYITGPAPRPPRRPTRSPRGGRARAQYERRPGADATVSVRMGTVRGLVSSLPWPTNTPTSS